MQGGNIGKTACEVVMITGKHIYMYYHIKDAIAADRAGQYLLYYNYHESANDNDSLPGQRCCNGNLYSQTSDSGPSEIGTQYNKPLYKGRFSRSHIIGLPMVLIRFEPPRRGQLTSLQRTKDFEFILFPKCPLFGGLTVITIDYIFGVMVIGHAYKTQCSW